MLRDICIFNKHLLVDFDNVRRIETIELNEDSPCRLRYRVNIACRLFYDEKNYIDLPCGRDELLVYLYDNKILNLIPGKRDIGSLSVEIEELRKKVMSRDHSINFFEF